MLLQNAAVHDHENPRFAGFFRGFFVDHFFLHPDGRNFQLDGLIDDLFDEFRTPEDIHDVDLLRDIQQGSIGFLA